MPDPTSRQIRMEDIIQQGGGQVHIDMAPKNLPIRMELQHKAKEMSESNTQGENNNSYIYVRSRRLIFLPTNAPTVTTMRKSGTG